MLAYAGVVGFGAADGGFFPRWWGLGAMCFAGATALALLMRRPELPRRSLVFVGALTSFAAFVALSSAWSASVPLTALDAQRVLLYLAGALAAVVVTPAPRRHALLAGTLAGAVTVAVWNLTLRIRDAGEVVDLGNRGVLAQPVGYENALALLCVLGLLLALGLRPLPPLRAAAAVPLAAVLSASGSRAGWLSLVVGLLVVFALDPHALRAPGLLLGAAGAAAVAAATPTLEPDVGLERAEAAALPLAGGLVALALLAAAVELAGPRVRALVPVPAAVGRRTRIAALAGIVPVLAAGVVGLGDQRRAYWEVALDQARENPLLGDGAGTFVRSWLSERDVALGARDAHGLLVETLGELGPLGVALLVLVLALPFAGAGRTPVAAAVLAAFLAHAVFDWDWEMPVVALPALFAAAALTLADERRVRPTVTLATASLALGVLALPNLAGQAALARSTSAASVGDFDESADAARRARRALPWDSEPLLRLAVAERGRGDVAAARTAIHRAIDRDPGDPRLWLVLAELGAAAERGRALERVEQLDPLGAPSRER